MAKGKAATFAVQARSYFGLLPGEGLAEFVKEIRALSDNDKAELSALLTAEDYPVENKTK